MTKVTFLQDVFPHVRGDVKDLSREELKRVDEMAKARNLEGAVYKNGTAGVDGPDRDAEASQAVRENLVDQAAQLEAQRNAKPEPANPEALGVKAEDPVVVTGTEPVDDVQVDNAQVATDIGSGEGANVVGPEAKNAPKPKK